MKKELIYEGKGKKLYTTDNEDLLIAEFKDDLTAFNAQKKAKDEGKGILNKKISTLLFNLLQKHGIATHLVESLSDTTQLVKKVKIIPLEVVVRNIASGSLVKRLGFKDGEVLDFPLVEFYYKDDDLEDPLVNDEHCLLLKIVKSKSDLEELSYLGRSINDILKRFFKEVGLLLVDFKVEFGIDKDGKILLADEISPDSCRLWDEKTHEKMDKDRFRQDLGGLHEAYAEVLKRLEEHK